MCVIMALGVVFDSKSWYNHEYGLFEFNHSWVAVLCIPMLSIVPIIAFIVAIIVPMEIGSVFFEYTCRLAIFIALLLCAIFITVTVASVALFCKGMMQADRS